MSELISTACDRRIRSWEEHARLAGRERAVPGIGGGLVAVQQNTEAPVLQLANLHGDIIATVPDSETASKLSSALNTTEYGVPTTVEPPKYSWLGAGEFPTELASGVVGMGARSYVPQLGRFLQPDPQPGGSANAYAYTYGNPLNESDPSGEDTEETIYGGLSAVGDGEAIHLEDGVGLGAGAIVPSPVNVQAEEAFWANPPWDQVTAGSEEYEEYGEEYGEEVAYHPGEREQANPLLEEGLFFWPEGNSQGTTALGSVLRLCTVDSDQACGDPAGLDLRKSLCAGLAIAVAAGACGNQVKPDDGPPDYDRVVQVDRGIGKEAEKAAEKAGGDGDEMEEDLEIACAIFCPD